MVDLWPQLEPFAVVLQQPQTIWRSTWVSVTVSDNQEGYLAWAGTITSYGHNLWGPQDVQDPWWENTLTGQVLEEPGIPGQPARGMKIQVGTLVDKTTRLRLTQADGNVVEAEAQSSGPGVYGEGLGIYFTVSGDQRQWYMVDIQANSAWLVPGIAYRGPYTRDPYHYPPVPLGGWGT